MPSQADKGKGKASGKGKAILPSERDPLLGSPSRSRSLNTLEDDAERPTTSARARSILFTALIILSSLLISVALFLALLAYSFKPSEAELAALPKTAFRYSFPDSVSVLNITDDGLLLNVSMRCGIDMDMSLGLQAFASADEKEEAGNEGRRGTGADWWEALRRRTANKLVSQVPQQAVEVSILDDVHVFPHHFSMPPLLRIVMKSPLLVPLVSGVSLKANPDALDWLERISFTAIAKPLASTGQLWEFVQGAWVAGSASVVVGVSKVEVKLPEGGPWWAKYGQGGKEDVVMVLDIPVPHLPGLPLPGHHLNLSELITLRRFTFDTDEEAQALVISATATLPNIAPNINSTLPFGLPFAVSIPESSDPAQPGVENIMAAVVTQPIRLGAGKQIELTMSGHVSANLGSNDPDDSPENPSFLSRFLQDYLHGRDNPIIIRGLDSLPSFAPPSTEQPPAWLLSSLPSLSVPLIFPGPKPKPKVVHSVTIDHVRLSRKAGKINASGTVIVLVDLPPDMQTIEVEVRGVQPDIIVFDGLAPDSAHDPSNGDGDDEDLPPSAFGHIRPDDFLPAVADNANDTEHPYRLIVRAPLADVPLDILPGRDSVFHRFVRKVIFKGGAQAGLLGTASVKVKLLGVEGTVRIDDLPVRGEFRVGR